MKPCEMVKETGYTTSEVESSQMQESETLHLAAPSTQAHTDAHLTYMLRAMSEQ